MTEKIVTRPEYAHIPVRPQPTSPPASPSSLPVDQPTMLVSAVTLSDESTAAETVTNDEPTTPTETAENPTENGSTATVKKPSPKVVQRESMLDILRDAAIPYEPATRAERMFQSFTAEARQAEHDQVINARFNRAIYLAENELVSLGDGENGVDPVIIELNQKGGAGKSPNGTSSAVTLAANNDQVIIVVDGNQVLGSTLQYLDIHDTLGVRDSMEKFKENTTYAFVRKHLGHHPKYKNIYGVGSDSSEKRRNNPIDLTEYYTYGKGLKSACQTLIFDNGNEVINAQTIVGLELAHVLRFVTIPWVNLANQLCKDTMAEIRALYPEKVERAVITISACRTNDAADMDIDHWASFFNHPKEQICLIPYDPIFQPRVTIVDGEPTETAWVVDLDQFNKQTYLANLERDILTLKQARKGIEAGKQKEETDETIIKRMLGFLQTNADQKSPQQAAIDQAEIDARIEEEVRRRLPAAVYSHLNPAS